MTNEEFIELQKKLLELYFWQDNYNHAQWMESFKNAEASNE